MRIVNRSALLHVALLSLSVVFAPLLLAQSAPAIPSAPSVLQPPSGQAFLLFLIGRGHQVYMCQEADGAYAWKLKGPEAQLVNAKGESVGHHFAGPTWEANDGSRVVGKMLVSVPSPNPQAVPWLLLTAQSHEGTGIMTKVETIQRLDTEGGIAPSIACSSSNKGENVLVPYQAHYYFYGTP